MNKKLAMSLLGVFLIAILALGFGCGGDAKPETGPETDPGITPVADEKPDDEKVYELKFNTWDPPGIGVSLVQEEACKMMEERSGGRLKVTPYFSSSLVAYDDVFKGYSTGVADIGVYIPSTNHDLATVFGVMQVGTPSFDVASKAYQKLIETVPELQEEMAQHNVRWLGMRAHPASQIHTMKKLVKLPSDLKGMKIICTGALAQAAEHAGAAAIFQAPADWYTSLERALAEGQIHHWAALHAYKTTELLKYHVNVGEGGLNMSGTGIVMNLDSWNSLPPDLQEIVSDVYRWVMDECTKFDVDFVGVAQKDCLEAGHVIEELTAEEIQQWDEVVKPFTEEWVKETEAKGYPARKVLDQLNQIYEELR